MGLGLERPRDGFCLQRLVDERASDSQDECASLAATPRRRRTAPSSPCRVCAGEPLAEQPTQETLVRAEGMFYMVCRQLSSWDAAVPGTPGKPRLSWQDVALGDSDTSSPLAQVTES